jgi:hypothetical protein
MAEGFRGRIEPEYEEPDFAQRARDTVNKIAESYVDQRNADADYAAIEELKERVARLERFVLFGYQLPEDGAYIEQLRATLRATALAE